MGTEDFERGRAEERERIGKILSSSEARRQPQLAAQLAFKQFTPAEQALGVIRSFETAANSDANGAFSWDEIVDRQNAEAGLAGSKVSAAADPWDDTIGIVNRENGR